LSGSSAADAFACDDLETRVLYPNLHQPRPIPSVQEVGRTSRAIRRPWGIGPPPSGM